MREGDNKALGVGYLVKEDKLHIKTSINFSRRNKNMRVGQDLQLDQSKDSLSFNQKRVIESSSKPL